MKKNWKKKTGFTIIEVVLVLAVAGLIFLITFSALPALQVSSRDTQRRESLTTLVSKVKEYQQNNRGALPSEGTAVNGDKVEKSDYTIANAGATSWAGFYRDYLGKSFRDPLGYMYNLSIVACGAKKADQACTANKVSELANGLFKDRNYEIVIVTSATCSGDKAVRTSSSRKIAALYKLEGAGVYCHGT